MRREQVQPSQYQLKHLQIFPIILSNLSEQPREVIDQFAIRFKIQGLHSQTKEQIIENIFWRIEEIIIAKYKPYSQQQFESVSNNLLRSLLPNEMFEPKKIVLAPKAKNIHFSQISGCYCQEKKPEDERTLTCSVNRCSRVCHFSCLPWSQKKLGAFECPSCIILSNDPLNKIEQVLVEPSILLSGSPYYYNINNSVASNILANNNIAIEVRMIKLDGKYFIDQTWPDKCEIEVNGSKIANIDPLITHSSLKKRKDQKFLTRNKYVLGRNSFVCKYQNIQDGKNTDFDKNPIYVLAVLLVKRQTALELSQHVVAHNKLTIEESKNQIIRKFEDQKDVGISEIKVDLVCKLTYTPLNLPARGINCQHIDCFDLLYFLKSMENNNLRKWTCPLCRKYCSKIIIDDYLSFIIKNYPDKEQIFFKPNGEFAFEENKVFEEVNKSAEKKKKNLNLNELIIQEEKKKNQRSIMEDDFDVLSLTSEDEEEELQLQSIDRKLNSIDEILSSKNNVSLEEKIISKKIDFVVTPIKPVLADNGIGVKEQKKSSFGSGSTAIGGNRYSEISTQSARKHQDTQEKPFLGKRAVNQLSESKEPNQVRQATSEISELSENFWNSYNAGKASGNGTAGEKGFKLVKTDQREEVEDLKNIQKLDFENSKTEEKENIQEAPLAERDQHLSAIQEAKMKLIVKDTNQKQVIAPIEKEHKKQDFQFQGEVIDLL